MTNKSPNIDPTRLREIAVRACCDPRTVEKYLLGDSTVQSTRAHSIQRAMEELEIPPAVREADIPKPQPGASAAPTETELLIGINRKLDVLIGLAEQALHWVRSHEK